MHNLNGDVELVCQVVTRLGHINEITLYDQIKARQNLSLQGFADSLSAWLSETKLNKCTPLGRHYQVEQDTEKVEIWRMFPPGEKRRLVCVLRDPSASTDQDVHGGEVETDQAGTPIQDADSIDAEDYFLKYQY